MNAAPLLNEIVATLAQAKLEAILIGNAAAAIHGAPVTTLDFDFMFRETPSNLTKLKLKRKNKRPKRRQILTALRKESDRDLVDLIRRRLALPVEKRLNFLRVRRPGGGSHL